VRRSTRLRAGPAVLGRSAESRDSNPLYAEFAAALDKYDFRFRLGEKVTGTVLLVLNKGIYVDIGAKSAAFCPIAECGMGKVARVRSARPARGNPKPRGSQASELCAVGDRVEFVIVKEESETKDQIVLLSLRRIEARGGWAQERACR
jgi:small subunit ribosomal protein S1